MNGKDKLKCYFDGYRKERDAMWGELASTEKGTFVIDVTTNDISFIEGSKYGMFNVAGKLNIAVAHNGFTSLFTTVDVEKLRNRTKVVKEYLETVLYDDDAAAIILSTIR